MLARYCCCRIRRFGGHLRSLHHAEQVQSLLRIYAALFALFGAGRGSSNRRLRFLQQRPKLQTLVDSLQQLFIGRLNGKTALVECDRYLSADGRQEAGEANSLHLRLHLALHRSFQLVGVSKQVLYIPILPKQVHSGLFAHSLAAGNVVAAIAHQSQQVNHLAGTRYAVFGAHFFHTHLLKAAAMPRTIHVDMLIHQLPIVFVGRRHIYFKAGRLTLLGKCSYHIVCLIACHLKNRYPSCGKDILDVGHSKPNLFRLCFSLCFVQIVCLVPKGISMRVKRYTDMGGRYPFDKVV